MLHGLILPVYEPAPVADSLTPPLEAFPPSLRDVLTHLPPRSLAPSDIRLQHIHLIHSITFSPPEPAPPIFQPSDTPHIFDRVANPVSGLVLDSINSAVTNQQLGNGVHPLALHLPNSKVGLEYTIHPLLAVINEDRAHHHRMKTPGPTGTGYQQLPLVVAYLYAMAQRWFTAVDGEDRVDGVDREDGEGGVKGEEEVRVWAITTRVEQTADVFWADVKRGDVARLHLRVRRSGRWDGLGQVQEKRDLFGRLVRGIWQCVWQRAPPGENLRIWGMPRECAIRAREEARVKKRREEECAKRRREEKCRFLLGKRRRILS